MGRKEIFIRIFSAILTIFVMIIVLMLSTKLGIFMAIFETLLLILFAYAVGPLLALLLGIKAGQLFTGSRKHELLPLMSEAETLCKRGEYEKSILLYRDIQEQFPNHFPLYRPLFELLFVRTEDPEEARAVYKVGWMKMNEEDRKRLEHLFQEFQHIEKKK